MLNMINMVTNSIRDIGGAIANPPLYPLSINSKAWSIA
jgi:hypothetical protein